MSGEETTDPSEIGVSRRGVLAAATAGGTLALAGCPGDDDTACDATLEKDVDGEFAYGGQGTYVFDICTPSGTGDGGQECDGTFTVEDDLPDGITLDSVSGDWTASTSGWRQNSSTTGMPTVSNSVIASSVAETSSSAIRSVMTAAGSSFPVATIRKISS